MRPHVKLFISSKSVQGAFGQGKYRLLNAVREKGSLQKAAKGLNRSYRKAWGDIRRAEQGLGRRIVKRFRGGSKGGRMELTAFGLRLLRAWESYEANINKAVRKHYDTCFGTLFGGRFGG